MNASSPPALNGIAQDYVDKIHAFDDQVCTGEASALGRLPSDREQMALIQSNGAKHMLAAELAALAHGFTLNELRATIRSISLARIAA